ncbi:transglycosylase SLT domain-containing protein [Methylopila musalis]|uniref:Transglycosylase SLT domain-containing protein n=1 Tax=Methylopila musalis TaxID=1134781 RepID=A0ABW3ZAI9_9HYPH
MALRRAVIATVLIAGALPCRAEAPAASRPDYAAIVRAEAAARGLPPEVADAVAHIESGYDPAAVGGVGEIGLMQIRPETAAMLGHGGGALGLFDPKTNARYAVRYLAEAWRLADGDLCRALMKYRAGHRAETMSPLSVEYCRRAKAYLATLGSPLADGVAPERVAIRSLAGDGGPKREGSGGGGRKGAYLGWRPGRHSEDDNRRFWAAHEKRIKALEAKIDARRKVRIARGG